MASEIRVNKINSQTGVGTITLSPTGVDISGVTTASTLRATTGIITTLQVGTISGDGSALTGVASTENIRTNTNATFLQNINVSGSTTTGSLVSGGAISGTTGTFTGDVDIADKIVHTGDTNTAIRFPSADTITAETGGSERIRLDSDGHFGVGTNNPTSQVDIHCGADNTGLQITSTDAGAFASYYDNTGASTIGHQGTDLVLSADPAGSVGSSKISFQVDSNAERATIDSTGDLTISDGDLVIGTSGHGIDFSATANTSATGSSTSAELLDDYEEGTWTPTINQGFTVSYSYQHGVYTKIGDMVYFNCYLQYSSISGSNSQGSYGVINGLPFASTYSNMLGYGAIVPWQYQLGQTVYFAYVDQNSSLIQLMLEPSGGDRAHTTANTLWSSGDNRIAASGWYKTSS